MNKINVDGVCVPIVNKEHKDICKWCGSENGEWHSIYDWYCKDCGKVTVD